MREKFDTQLVAGCTSQQKAEVEAHAAHEGLSIADVVRIGTLRLVRQRKQETADAA